MHRAAVSGEPTARRTALLLVLLALVVMLGWEAGTFLGLKRQTEKLLEPPSPAELSVVTTREAGGDVVMAGPAAAPLDPPVTLAQMGLWFALPLAGSTLLVFVTGRRR